MRVCDSSCRQLALIKRHAASFKIDDLGEKLRQQARILAAEGHEEPSQTLTEAARVLEQIHEDLATFSR